MYVRKSKRGYKNTKLTQEVIELARDLALLGATDEMMSRCFKVNIGTIAYWKQHNTDFQKAVQEGGTVADARVARGLYSRAVGYSHPEDVILTNQVKVYDEKGKLIDSHTEPLIVRTMKHYPPEPYAAHKWLSIRQRELWSDSTKIDITQTTTINVQYLQQIENPETVSDADLDLALAIGVQQAIAKESVSRN